MDLKPRTNISKRRRGRPRGSKNKAKGGKESCGFQPHVIEVSSGGDVAGAIDNLAASLGGAVAVLSAHGPVSSAALMQPCLSSSAVKLSGCFEILSIGVLPAGISVLMAGADGEVFGGVLEGPLVASGKVIVVAAELPNPTAEDDSEGAVIDAADGGDNDEWCRSWFGMCEEDLRRSFDLLPSAEASSVTAPLAPWPFFQPFSV